MEKRREPRFGVDVDARIRNGTGSSRYVTVSDLSRRGCRVTVPGNGFGIEAFVTITVAGVGFLDARVKWRDEKVHGLRFEQPLHPAVLDHIRAVLSRSAGLSGQVAMRAAR